MDSVSLYRTFRPKTFNEMISQEHITKTLENQVKKGEIGHAYLFVGSRGTGKTSAAKIFSKAINCEKSADGSPCCTCGTCKMLEQANNVDIMEIDAASNNGVDEARAIRDKVKYPPLSARYKVFIIDEVHMLTDAAFNALLKTLEEPPPYVVFILATTEPHKIPATILSRCMKFDFRLVPATELDKFLDKIFKKAGITCENDARMAIALAGEGSVRDALSIADCLAAATDKKITLKAVREILGNSSESNLFAITEAIIKKDAGLVLKLTSELIKEGKNLSVVTKDLLTHIRNLIITVSCENPEKILLLPAESMEKLKKQAESADREEFLNLLKIFSGIENSMRTSLSPQVLFETAALTACLETEKKKTVI